MQVNSEKALLDHLLDNHQDYKGRSTSMDFVPAAEGNATAKFRSAARDLLRTHTVQLLYTAFDNSKVEEAKVVFERWLDSHAIEKFGGWHGSKARESIMKMFLERVKSLQTGALDGQENEPILTPAFIQKVDREIDSAGAQALLSDWKDKQMEYWIGQLSQRDEWKVFNLADPGYANLTPSQKTAVAQNNRDIIDALSLALTSVGAAADGTAGIDATRAALEALDMDAIKAKINTDVMTFLEKGTRRFNLASGAFDTIQKYSHSIERALIRNILKAKADGKVLLAMEHHLIMPHIHPLISGHGMCVGDREYVASRLADAGLKYMFTGHSHVLRVSDFVSEKGNKIFQVNIGAAVGYPSPIVNVTVDGEDVSIETVHAPTFEYNGTQDTLKYTAKHFFEMFDRALTGAAGKDTKEFADRMDALGIDGKKAAKFHPFVKLPARYLLKVRVRGAYRLANALTLGRVIDKRDAKEFADRPVLDFIHDIMLAAVGGTPERHSADSAYCRLVKQVASIPSFFVRKNKALRELPEVAELIVTGGKYNAYKCDLK